MSAVPAATHADVERRVLAIVGELVGELGGPGRAPAPNASLERDLDISSLERVELLVRLERAFGVRLPDPVMAAAATPNDLVIAIRAAVPAGPPPAPVAPAGPATPAPTVIAMAPPGVVLETSSGKARPGGARDAGISGLQAGAMWMVRAIAQAIFTAWVLLVASTLPLLWAYLACLRPCRHADRATRWWCRMAARVCGLRPRVTGLQHLGGIESGILVANHASYIDSVVLMAAIPADFHFVAKRRLARYPLIGTVIRKAGHLTIEKADHAQRLTGADDVARLVREGKLLLIFPEGTFRRPPALLPFRLGAFRAAVETGRPIVPIAIRGTRHVLPSDTWLFRHGRIGVTIGAPLQPKEPGWPEMVRLRDLARAEIERGSGEVASPPAGYPTAMPATSALPSRD